MTVLRTFLIAIGFMAFLTVAYVFGYLVVRHVYRHEIFAGIGNKVIGKSDLYVRFRSSSHLEVFLYYLFVPAGQVDMACGGRSLYLDSYSDKPSGSSYIDYGR